MRNGGGEIRMDLSLSFPLFPPLSLFLTSSLAPSLSWLFSLCGRPYSCANIFRHQNMNFIKGNRGNFQFHEKASFAFLLTCLRRGEYRSEATSSSSSSPPVSPSHRSVDHRGDEEEQGQHQHFLLHDDYGLEIISRTP